MTSLMCFVTSDVTSGVVKIVAITSFIICMCIHLYNNVHAYVYMCMYVSVCVCVTVCALPLYGCQFCHDIEILNNAH